MTTQIDNSITDQIADIIVNQVHCPRELIVPEAEFETDLGFDSLDVAEFIINLEETFNIEVPDDEAEQIRTVHKAILKVEQAIQK